MYRLQIPLLVIAALLGLFFSAEQSEAGDTIMPAQCCRCHGDVCQQSDTKLYVHAPFLENNCAVCHVRGGLSSAEPAVVAEDFPDEVSWFARACQENKEHWFELPSSLAGTTIALLATAGSGKILAQEVALPALDQLPPLPGPPGEGKISDLHLVEVKKGVFVSARIAWKTNRLANAQLFFGKEELSSTTAVDHCWATDHEITLAGLAANREYKFVAVSRDIAGNEVSSPAMTLSTRNFFARAARQPAAAPDNVALQAAFYQQEGRFFAHFAGNQPVTMRLGQSAQQALRTMGDGMAAKTPADHLALTDSRSLTITVCVGCHPQSHGVRSHPVDIAPKAGMVIPPDYQTLADGRLSCMSCHQAHASEHEYRLTRASRKELCLGCHRNFG